MVITVEKKCFTYKWLFVAHLIRPKKKKEGLQKRKAKNVKQKFVLTQLEEKWRRQNKTTQTISSYLYLKKKRNKKTFSVSIIRRNYICKYHPLIISLSLSHTHTHTLSVFTTFGHFVRCTSCYYLYPPPGSGGVFVDLNNYRWCNKDHVPYV